MTIHRENRPTVLHQRFNVKFLAFKNDFVGALAKWLVKQSPYVIPDNLDQCLLKFHERLNDLAAFDVAGMSLFEPWPTIEKIEHILESIPEIMALNEPRNKDNKAEYVFVTRLSGPLPDDDLIDIEALARNVVIDMLERDESQRFLEQEREKIPEP